MTIPPQVIFIPPEIFEVGFFTKQLLLGPLEMPRTISNMINFFELFEFEVDSVILARPRSHNPHGTCDTMELPLRSVASTAESLHDATCKHSRVATPC